MKYASTSKTSVDVRWPTLIAYRNYLIPNISFAGGLLGWAVAKCNEPTADATQFRLAFRIAKKMKKSMVSRGFAVYANHTTLRICELLDPRSKSLAFTSIETADAVTRQLYEAAAAIVPDEQVEVAFDEWITIFNDIDMVIAMTQATTRFGYRPEVESYLCEPSLERKGNPFAWWNQLKST